MNAETSWFHVFRSTILDGEILKMGDSAFVVYCTIKAHVGFNTGKAFPSVSRLKELTGKSKNTVLRALKHLETLGFLIKEKNGKKNTYQLREKIKIKDDEGGDVAIASWDYLPSLITNAQAELKRYVHTGVHDGKIICIETINIQNNYGDQNEQVNFNLKEQISRIKDPKLKATMERIQAKRKEVEKK